MRILVILTLSILTSSLVAQSTRAPEAATQHYEFHISYWFNMHHLLWTEAFLNAEVDSSIIDVQLNEEEQGQLDAALQYYRDNLIQYNLRAGGYMGRFRDWIIQQKGTIPNVPEDFRVQMKVMFGFDAVYRRYFWSAHKSACELVLEQNLPLIKATEGVYVEEISRLAHQSWQKERIQVSITFLGGITKRNLRNRPYNTFSPTHVVMNTVGDDSVEGAWLESLYYESAQHLASRTSHFIGGTINDVAEIHQITAPRSLWRAYLSYFAGTLTQQLLEKQGIEYPYIYMERKSLFSRSQAALKPHLSNYMQRKTTLAEATLLILQALPEQDE